MCVQRRRERERERERERDGDGERERERERGGGRGYFLLLFTVAVVKWLVLLVFGHADQFNLSDNKLTFTSVHYPRLHDTLYTCGGILDGCNIIHMVHLLNHRTWMVPIGFAMCCGRHTF